MLDHMNCYITPTIKNAGYNDADVHGLAYAFYEIQQ